MKLFILSILLSSSLHCVSQERAIKEAFKINNTISLGKTKADVVSQLGLPTRTSNYYNEMQDVHEELLHYGGSTLFIREDYLVSFQIKDSSLDLYYINTQISIGEKASIIESLFPTSYNQRDQSDYNAIHIKLTSAYGGTLQKPVDEYINVLFNPKSKLIKQVVHGIY